MSLISSAGAREAWLDGLAARLSDWIDREGFTVPSFRISEGFPSTGMRGRALAESWHDRESDGFVILVRPDQDDTLKVAAALAHEMIRIAVAPLDKRGYLFQHVASGIGLSGNRSATRPVPLFHERLNSVLQDLGPMPPSPGDSHPVMQPAKQNARLIKVSCPECGYVARVARKWLTEAGPPHCPQHGSMQVDAGGGTAERS